MLVSFSLLQEALHREQMLEQKLATLQRLLASTQEASESSWQVRATGLCTLKRCTKKNPFVLRLFIVFENMRVVLICYYLHMLVVFFIYYCQPEHNKVLTEDE